MKLFIMYFRPLIEDGRVYLAVPPLYSIVDKRHHIQYFTGKAEYTAYLVDQFAKSYKVGPNKKTLFTKRELTALLHKNVNYIDDLNVFATNYALEPQLLDFILRYRGKSLSWFQNFLKQRWRFMTVEKKNGVMIADGLAGNEFYTAVCSDRLYAACQPLMGYIQNSLDSYYVNGEKMTLLELMKTFNKFKPNGIQRYKGLGEMSVKALAQSTLHPDGDRKLLQLTTDNIKEDIMKIRDLQSDLSALLKNVDMSLYDV